MLAIGIIGLVLLAAILALLVIQRNLLVIIASNQQTSYDQGTATAASLTAADESRQTNDPSTGQVAVNTKVR